MVDTTVNQQGNQNEEDQQKEARHGTAIICGRFRARPAPRQLARSRGAA